ncbi:MAG: c-type cytochrome [Flavisolibacter sp.]
MKSRIVLLLTAGLVAMSLSGCYKDIISPGQDPNAPPQNISFSGDLLPIFEANCTTSGCHDAVPGHNPSLVKENAYNAITAGGYVNTVVPAASKLYGEVKGGSMPPTGALNAKDVQKILDWIRNGAPNN